ncbi:MAG: hypothetical protein ACE5EV_00645 [Gaiellales bacterium]
MRSATDHLVLETPGRLDEIDISQRRHPMSHQVVLAITEGRISPEP